MKIEVEPVFKPELVQGNIHYGQENIQVYEPTTLAKPITNIKKNNAPNSPKVEEV